MMHDSYLQQEIVRHHLIVINNIDQRFCNSNISNRRHVKPIHIIPPKNY